MLAGGVLGEMLRSETSLTLLDPRDVTPDRAYENDVLPYRSRLVVCQLLQLFVSRRGLPLRLSRADLGARITHRSSRYQDAAGLTRIPHQTSFDLETSAGLLDDQLALRAQVSNVFDDAQYDIVGLPLPGRTLHASAEVTWP
jgi:outer membrane cobalamin receptor